MSEIIRTISVKTTTTVEIEDEHLQDLIRMAVGAPADAQVTYERYDGAQVIWTEAKP